MSQLGSVVRCRRCQRHRTVREVPVVACPWCAATGWSLVLKDPPDPCVRFQVSRHDLRVLRDLHIVVDPSDCGVH